MMLFVSAVLRFVVFYVWFESVIIQSISLNEPEILYLLDGESYSMSIDYCSLEIYDEEDAVNLLLSMNAHCFCLYDSSTSTSYNCSSPGPTLIAYSGSSFDVTFYNKLNGDDEVNTSLANEYRDLDIVNIHTHGLHISPDEDDVTITIAPGSSYKYSYTIIDDHYPGLHWYHPHHHGDTSFLIHSGLYGALIIENNDISQDENLVNMKENVLVFQYFYVVRSDDCDCTDSAKLQSQVIWPGDDDDECIKNCGNVGFVDENVLYSYCFEYCAFPAAQRSSSSFVYEMDSYRNDWELFLINGQYQPVIDDLVINKWRRLRIVLTDAQYFRQFEFPTTNCEWKLIAIDGIYLLDDEIRDLSSSPYNGMYFMFGGSRADILVKCDTVGTYNIISTQDTSNADDEISEFVLPPADITYFSITVNDDDVAPYNDIDGNNISSLPSSYPERPNYLTSMIDLNDDEVITECPCNTFYSDDVSRFLDDENQCAFVFAQSINDVNTMNGLQFDENTPLTTLTYGEIYEFYFKSQGHSFHQHVNPFQLTQDIGNGYLGQNGDFFDTFASEEFTYRMNAADFTGHVIAHCHILPHEDTGMMGWYLIEENGCNNNSTTDDVYDHKKFNLLCVFCCVFQFVIFMM